MYEIIRYIGFGKENAITLSALAHASGMSERAVRRAVHDINAAGLLMIIREHQKGYFMPETAEEIDGYIRYNISYRKELNKKIAGMRKYRRNNFGSGAVYEADN